MHVQPFSFLLLALLVFGGSAGIAWDWRRRRLQADVWDRSAAALLGRAQRSGWTTRPQRPLDQQAGRPHTRALFTDGATATPAWKRGGGSVLAPLDLPAGLRPPSSPGVEAGEALSPPDDVPAARQREAGAPDTSAMEVQRSPRRMEPAHSPPPVLELAEFKGDAAPAHPPDWMTVREICYETRLSATFVRKQLRSGALPFAVFGTRLRVRRSDYEDWLARSSRTR